jgi:hypothetical protein
MRHLKEILDRAHEYATSPNAEGWPEPENDAVVLSFYVRRLVRQVHNLNDRIAAAQHPNKKRRIPLPNPSDLCPLCAGSTWGRPNLQEEAPNGTWHDYSRRVCSECGLIRCNPPGEE